MPVPAQISQDSDSELPTKVVSKSRKHSIYTHFPKDRRRTGEALLRAEKFGDLMTADHKVLDEGCESRDNHGYAVMVQDVATQWIQAYPCKTKTS